MIGEDVVQLSTLVVVRALGRGGSVAVATGAATVADRPEGLDHGVVVVGMCGVEAERPPAARQMRVRCGLCGVCGTARVGGGRRGLAGGGRAGRVVRAGRLSGADAGQAASHRRATRRRGAMRAHRLRRPRATQRMRVAPSERRASACGRRGATGAHQARRQAFAQLLARLEGRRPARRSLSPARLFTQMHPFRSAAAATAAGR